MPHELALKKEEIQELRAAGYTVERAVDNDTSGYVWRHKDGASQVQDTPQQPPRRTKEQAWYDCAQYHGMNVSSTPEPDWAGA
jgi:hypothetical protein